MLGSKLCRPDRGILAKSADIWLSGQHVADMLATFSAKIEIDIPESTDEDDDTDRSSDYANHFFDSFKDSSLFTRRDVDFIYELAENTTRLILDENLNEDSLAVQVLNRLLMCLNYMFMKHPDMQRPSLNTIDQ